MGRHREETPYSQQTTVQSKPDLPNTTALFCRLSVLALRASMAVWENVHACDFTHSWKLHCCIRKISQLRRLRTYIDQLTRNNL